MTVGIVVDAGPGMHDVKMRVAARTAQHRVCITQDAVQRGPGQ